MKLVEEALEALEQVGLPDTAEARFLIESAAVTRALANRVFDDQQSWSLVEPEVDDTTDSEMADVLVVLANYAVERGANLMLMAFNKSEADVIRGER